MGGLEIIDRENIDVKRWDELVRSSPEHTFFSFSWYLDATAKNWCILTDNYQFGIALPYTSAMGVEALYTPIFVRFLEWFGARDRMNESMRLIETRFSSWNIQFANGIVLGGEKEQFVYQLIKPEQERKIGSQAKRMLKKAERQGFEIKSESSDYLTSFDLVKCELNGKHEGLNNDSMKSLEALISAASMHGFLKVYSIDAGAAIFCLEDNSQVLYLKGTANKEMKDKGAFYFLMDSIIDQTLGEGKLFDFGGSRMEGVKRFNTNLGGVDQIYFRCANDALPIWYKFAKGLKRKWKK